MLSEYQYNDSKNSDAFILYKVPSTEMQLREREYLGFHPL